MSGTLLSHEMSLIGRLRVCFLRLSSDFQNAVVPYVGNEQVSWKMQKNVLEAELEYSF